MDEPAELRNNRQWRLAVGALRVGYLALAITIVGIIVMSSGSTPWILALGVIIWLVAATVTLTGVFRARSELPEPRPGFWPMRWMLLHDTVHVRRSVERFTVASADNRRRAVRGDEEHRTDLPD